MGCLLGGGDESSQFDALQTAIGNVTLSDQCDSWQWSLDVFVGCIPIKVNVFLWRLNLNKLPSGVNLDTKGIDASSILCPNCLGDVGMVNHTFFNCGMAKHEWALLVNWWELDILMCANILEWYVWLDSLYVTNRARLFLEGVGGTHPYGAFVIT
ncbi:RNA-directed DNA polymerase, eukaryota, reverse transcriptase zinc-binding domain protein [Tanacetum coccineum]|uniref:RNA-directed DNA polymerase, eukaryota, reverse transcriptase zinc-binding domain protein n=1 Tax=Tanacetum coccineum TaxID=301880 RepID=A0ABQ4XJ31_9ASTR